MNDILNTLLANASTQGQEQNPFAHTPAVGLLKQAAVSNSAANKVAALSGSVPTAEQMYPTLAAESLDVADKSLNQTTYDYLYADPFTLQQKYGYRKTDEILNNRLAAQNKVRIQQISDRNWNQTAADTVSGVGLGAANAIGGIAALGTGLVSSGAGQAISEQLDRLNNFGRSTQSPALQAHRSLLEAADQVSAQNNDAQYKADIAAGDDSFIAGTKRIGRGILDGVKNAVQDPTALSDIVAEGSGSLAALGPVSALSGANKAKMAATAFKEALAAGKTVQEAAAIRAGILAKEGLAIPAAIGAMEAGGSYTGNVNDVMNMTHEQLLAGSPAYKQLIADGVSPEEAKQIVADRAGLLAATITAPTAVLAGKLVSKFEADPLAKVSARTAGMNIARETTEEGLQGGFGGLAQNVGIQSFADQNKALSDNVGEQIGRGAVAGAGMAGTFSAPSLVKAGVKQAAKSTLDAAGKLVDKALSTQEIANQKSSKTSIGNIVNAANVISTTANEVQTAFNAVVDEAPNIEPEKKTEVKNYLSSLVQALQITPEESTSLGVEGAINKLHAIQLLGQKILDTKPTDNTPEAALQTALDKVNAAMAIHKITDPITNLVGEISNTPEAVDSLPAEAKKIISAYTNTLNALFSSKDVNNVLEATSKIFDDQQVRAKMNQEDQTQLTAELNAAAAVLAPAMVNPKVAGNLMKMATEGKLNLTPEQKQALTTAKALMDSAIEYDASLATDGASYTGQASELVGVQVKTGEDTARDIPARQSGLQHIQAIARLMRSNKITEAKAQMTRLANFVISQNNKVNAINQHFAAGSPSDKKVKFKVAASDGNFYDSTIGAGVTPTSVDSLKFVKRVNAEAAFLANLHNKLAEAFPQLGATPIQAAKLDAALRGNAQVAADEFKAGTRKVPGATLVKPVATANEQSANKTDESANSNATKTSSNKLIEQTKLSTPTGSKVSTQEPKGKNFLLDLLGKIKSGISSLAPKAFKPNAEQQEGIDKIKAFISAPSSEGRIFVLDGKAGTGKTSLIQEAVRDYLTQGNTVTVSAISHKAKGVLEQKLSSFIKSNSLRGNIEAFSVASLLGMKRDDATGKFTPDKSQSSDKPINNVSLLIVDEASMLNVEAIELLESNLPAGVKVIYAGDSNQIAPIESNPKYRGKISQIFSKDTGKNKHSLSIRVRQGENSSILPYADYYWNNAQKSLIGNGEGVIKDPVPASARKDTDELVMLSNDGWLDKVIPLFKEALKTGNSNLVKIIAFNNLTNMSTSGGRMLRDAQAKIRVAMFGESPADYNVGEQLIMTNNWGNTKKEGIENSTELVVVSTKSKKVTVRLPNRTEKVFEGHTLVVKNAFSGETYNIPVIASESIAAYNEFLEAWRQEALKTKQWKEYYFFKENVFAPVAYAYILTAHKAQGSTYDSVIVLEDNMQQSPDTIANVSRLMYTGITRASKLAVIVSNKNNEQNTNNQATDENLDNQQQQWFDDQNQEDNPADSVPPDENTPFFDENGNIIDINTTKSTKVKLTGTTKHLSKDQAKSDKATKFIGRGVAGSSTETYRNDWGDKANTGSYTSDDVVFVSSNGDRQGRVKPDFVEIDKAIAAGATFITDDKTNRNRAYNIGEVEVADYLTKNGYTEVEPGTWKKVTATNLVNDSNKPVSQVNTAASATTLEGAFSSLIGVKSAYKTVNNFFVKAFKFPKKAISRIFNNDTPIETIRNALSSNDALVAFVGEGVIKGTASKELLNQYSKLLDIADELVYSSNRQLKTGLTDYALKLLNGTTPGEGHNELLRQTQFKALNIVESNGKGGYQYNQNLIEGAVLASLHWFQTAFSTAAIRDENDVASIAGVSVDEITPDLMNTFNGSNLLLVDIIPKLSQTIRRFWGVQNNNDFDQSMVNGIAMAVATEMLEAMIANGMIGFKPTKVGDKTINVFSLNRVSQEDVVNLKDSFKLPNIVPAMPSLLGQIIEIEPEETMWFGDDLPPVAKGQMNNPLVRNTDDQLKALEKEQATEFFLNEPMFNLTSLLGKDFFLDVFGGGSKLNEKDINKNHYESQKGKNVNINSAFAQMNETISRLTAYATSAASSVADTAIHYAYNMSRTGRMHMLGRFNPQANKLMRELFMPNGTTIDLTQTENKTLYKLALAQMLGIKVHNMSFEESSDKLYKLLTGDLKPSINALYNYLATGQISKNDKLILADGIAKAGGTIMALHAMLDYARYLSPVNRSAYKTSVYVEADGVTNGPANAVMMLSSGAFTEADLNRMGMGGFFLESGKTMNQHRANTIDMYQTAANNLSNEINELGNELKDSDALFNKEIGTKKSKFGETIPKPTEMLKSVKELLSMFGGDISISKDGNSLEISRGATKNPLTVTIYGAGKAGLANKVISALSEVMYEQFSNALKAHKENPKLSIAEALFGATSTDPDAQLAKLEKALNSLTHFNVRFEPLSEGDHTMVYRTKQNIKDNKPLYTNLSINFDTLKDFTLVDGNLRAITNAISILYVSPLQKAITATVGHSVLGSASLIQVATQIQSVAMALEFKNTVEALINKVRKDGAPTEFLSKNQQDEIIFKLENKYPFLSNGLQTFFVGSSANTEVKASAFAQALSGKFKSLAMISGPADAGVAGIPYMVIGSGDALAIQLATNDPNGPERTLKIFDGVNLPLDQINSGSLALNAAVAKTWQRNPLRMVLQSLEKSAVNIEKLFPSDFVMNPENELTPEQNAIARAYNNAGVASAEELVERLRSVVDSIDARHAALQRVTYSVDQMASAAQPHQNQGEGLENLSSLSPENQAKRLTEIYKEELVKIKQGNKGVTKTVNTVVTTNKLTLSRDIIKTLLNTGFTHLNQDQKVVLREMLKSHSAEEYTIFFGSREELNNSFNAGLEENDLGATNYDSKHIYIVKDNDNENIFDKAETIVHELVHAATFGKVIEYFENGTTGNAYVDAAIKNLIDLESRLNNIPPSTYSKWSVDARAAYQNLQNTLKTIAANSTLSANQKKAQSLNEMMAWTLANKDLATGVKKLTILKKVLNAIVSLVQRILGTSADNVSMDFYDGVFFNTFVISQSELSATRVVTNATLKHNATYGNDVKLSQVEKNLQDKLLSFIQKPTNLLQGKRAVLFSHQLAASVRAVFSMTEQEYHTFQAITAVTATEAELNPNAVLKAQELYTHTMNNITAQSFMKDPVANDPNDAQQSLEKYNLLVGKSTLLTDANNRSSLLPVFLALAATNSSFNDVLRKIDLPKTVKYKGTTFDDYLRNYSNASIDWLSNHASGTSNSKTVSDAMGDLGAKLYELAVEKESMLEKLSAPAGSVINAANTKLTGMLTSLADTAYNKARKVQANSKSKLVKTAAAAVQIFSGIASESTANAVAEGVIELLNKTKGKHAIVDLINDLVGRTESNANVYDMIKVVRTAIQQLRQNFRENVPEVIESKFTDGLTDEVATALHTVMGKTDLAVLFDNHSFNDIAKLITDPAALAKEIKAIEGKITQDAPVNSAEYFAKAKQLANYMLTGIPGKALLRNANAIADLIHKGAPVKADAQIRVNIDQLVTLYALNNLSKNDRAVFASLIQNKQSDGLSFMLSYLKGQRKDEVAKATDKAYYNALKGYIPSLSAANTTLIVANDSEHAKLLSQSYVRVGSYDGEGIENIHKSYYFLPSNNRPSFAQGIMQNVVHTSGGVSLATGFTVGITAGIITDPVYLKRIWNRTNRVNKTSNEGYLPVFNSDGELIALERTVDPAQLQRLKFNTKIHQMIGVWRGRQLEEAAADTYNSALVKTLYDMYDRDRHAGKHDGYVDIFHTTDPVVADAVKLLNKKVIDEMKALNDSGSFYVRRTMLNDALGYHSASVGDMWTGNTRWNNTTQRLVKGLATLTMGNAAYAKLVNSERFVSNAVASAKQTIIIKSVIVPAANIVANLYQLLSRGVNPFFMKKTFPKKLQETEFYVKSSIRLVAAQAELLAYANDPIKSAKLEAEIKSINDSYERLSIWPLIQAGEFSSISDVGVNHEDLNIAQGKWLDQIDIWVDKLPANVRNAGRYAWITQDTALFQGLQKAVQYGDFLAKAILYDDLTKNKGISQKDALIRITEEFVNYDRLPGRFRGYMEQIGLLWFYNFKIRSVKVALSIIRNNPLHALFVNVLPMPEFFTGPIGSVIDDNLVTKGLSGELGNSIGLGQGFDAISLNPWVNIVD